MKEFRFAGSELAGLRTRFCITGVFVVLVVAAIAFLDGGDRVVTAGTVVGAAIGVAVALPIQYRSMSRRMAGLVLRLTDEGLERDGADARETMAWGDVTGLSILEKVTGDVRTVTVTGRGATLVLTGFQDLSAVAELVEERCSGLKSVRTHEWFDRDDPVAQAVTFLAVGSGYFALKHVDARAFEVWSNIAVSGMGLWMLVCKPMSRAFGAQFRGRDRLGGFVLVLVSVMSIALPQFQARGPSLVAPQRAARGAPMGEKPALTVARLFEAARAQNDAAALVRLIDWDTLGARVGFAPSAGTPPDIFREKFCASFLRSQADAHLKRLRVHARDGITAILYRIRPRAGGVNYLDVMVESGGGEPRIVDFRDYGSGSLSSETIRGGLRDEVLEHPGAYAMLKQVREGDLAGAVASFARLPREQQVKSLVMRQYLLAAKSLGESAYQEALEHCHALAPDEPELRFSLLDLHVAKGRFDQALDILERFGQSFGGDPYMGIVRAGILLQAGRENDAYATVKRTVAADPALLAEDPDVAAVIASEAYRAWEVSAPASPR